MICLVWFVAGGCLIGLWLAAGWALGMLTFTCVCCCLFSYVCCLCLELCAWFCGVPIWVLWYVVATAFVFCDLF